MCAMFGPAVNVTAFSKALVAKKTATPLNPDDTPDFSVACIEFESGVVARVTCSIIAPADHRLRVIGDEGEISADSYRNYQSPVMLERFSSVGLNARKARTIRLQPLIGRVFGVGGRELRLVRHEKSGALAVGERRMAPHKRLIAAIKRREDYSQDKLIGVAEMARAIRDGQPQPMGADFLLHITELTLAISRAGPTGTTMKPSTRFEPMQPMAATLADGRNFKTSYRPSLLERALESTVESLHKH
jgi:predicted dehydrogenase